MDHKGTRFAFLLSTAAMSHPKRSQKQSHTGRQPAGDISLRSVPRASLFEAGRNCWRVEQADRVSFLIDGEAYFRAFRDAAIKARHCIYDPRLGLRQSDPDVD